MELVIILGLATALLFGIADAVSALPARSISPIVMSFVIDLTSLLVFGFISMFFWDSYVWSVYTWLPIFAGMAAYVGFLSYIYAIKSGLVGVGAAIGNSYPLLTTIFAVIVLGEFLSWQEVFSVVFILSGIFFISFNFKELRAKKLAAVEKSIVFALVAMFFWAVQMIFMDWAAHYLPAFQITQMITLGALVLSSTVFFLSGYSLNTVKTISGRNLFFIITLSLMYFGGVLTANYGLGKSDLGVFSVIAGTSPFVTAIFAYFVFKERLTNKQWSAVLLVVVGLGLLGLSA